MSDFGGWDIGIMGEKMEPCTMIVKTTADTSDGQPGWDETYAEGQSFEAMFIKNSSTEAQIAQQQRLKEMYTVVVHRDRQVRHGDVFRREGSGEILIATSSTKDGSAPPSSTVPIAKFTAVPYDLPGEVNTA